MANYVVTKIGMAASVSTALFLAGFSSQIFAMSPFQASYQFNYNGKNLGSATRTLSKTGNQWSYVFSAKAGVIASATETSRFTFNDGKIGSSSFSRSSKILVHNNTMSINFNPSAKTINTKKDSETRSFAWKAGVLDELNAELQIREDLKSGGLKSSYYIADHNEVESRRLLNKVQKRSKPITVPSTLLKWC